jgi:hypothetical protein
MASNDQYPLVPGFQSGSETSRAAAASAVPEAESDTDLLIRYFKSDLGKALGMTIDEGAQYLSKEKKIFKAPGTASARFVALELTGIICKSQRPECRTRLTRSRKSARIYFLKGWENS